MNIKYSFLLTFLSGLSTMMGFLVLFFKRKNEKNIIISATAFASGVMFCVSIFDLIPESLKMLFNNYNKFLSIILFLIFLCIGLMTANFIDEKTNKKEKNPLLKVGTVSMIALVLHNIPEGIATFITSNLNEELGLSLAISIAMHNIPEGISISIPIYYSTKSKIKAFNYTLISALSEPFGALLAFIFLKNFVNDTFMGLLYSFIAGIMIYISIYELLFESLRYKKSSRTITFIIVGFIFMISNLLIF